VIFEQRMVGRVVVTGANGFIGRNLVARLAERDVGCIALAREIDGVEWPSGVLPVRTDYRNVDQLIDVIGPVDGFVHLAGAKASVCEQSPEDGVAANIDVTRAVLQLSQGCGAGRFIFASTYFVYEEVASDQSPSLESCQLGTTDLYAVTKWIGERLVAANGTPSALLRLGHVYGAGQQDHARDVVSHFLEKALKEEPIQVQADGGYVVQPISVADVCSLVVDLVLRPQPFKGVLNMAGPEALSVGAIAATVAAAAAQFGLKVEVRSDLLATSLRKGRRVSVELLEREVAGIRAKTLFDGASDFFSGAGVRATEVGGPQ
jgi:nucleoside-diphosphate-sugar epimerase